MVPSFVPMFTLVLMAVQRALVLSLSSLLMMLAMPFNNSTATTGKAALLKSVRIVSQTPVLDSVAVVDSEHVEDLAVDLEVVEGLVAEAALALEADEEVSEVATLLLPADLMLEL